MQRLPWVTGLSCGEVTFTISLSCTWSVRVQPTPQYAHTVDVRVCRDSSQVPAARMSNYVLGASAPVGHTSTQFPQYTQAESVSGASCSTAIRATKPRPATEIAKEFCHWSPQASTHLYHGMHLP